MNLYYAIYGNEAKIIDENEKKTTREVTENLSKILIKENEKEEMEYQLDIANGNINEAKKILRKFRISKLLFPLVGFVLGSILPSIVALILRDLSLLFYVNLDISLVFTVIGCLCTSVFHFCSPIIKEQLHAAELQAYFLENEIPIKEQELEKLKNNDKKLEPPIEQLGMEKVDDRETLLKLKEYLEKLEEYGKTLPKQADQYAKGLWSKEDKENLINNGIDDNLFENYLIEYNTRKLMKGKRVS